MPPIFSCVFCIRHFFYGIEGKKIVKMSNDKFGWFFSCFSHKTYLWSGRRDLGWRRSPFWILTHLFTRIFVQQREKLELFAIQYMTCHEQGTFFFALLMSEFVYELLDIAKYFVKKRQWYLKSFNNPYSQTVLRSNINKKILIDNFYLLILVFVNLLNRKINHVFICFWLQINKTCSF